jgi:hypothetical protein
VAAVKVLDGPLAAVSRDARDYPAHLLRYGGTGLCLFAARFYGVNDAIHMARAGMELTLVDTAERVLEMGEMYGCDDVHQGDAWEFADAARKVGWMWDAVSVDTYTGDAARRSLDSLDLWCSLARDVVTCTYVRGQDYTVPDGWADGKFMRNPRGGVYWLVLTRA